MGLILPLMFNHWASGPPCRLSHLCSLWPESTIFSILPIVQVLESSTLLLIPMCKWIMEQENMTWEIKFPTAHHQPKAECGFNQHNFSDCQRNPTHCKSFHKKGSFPPVSILKDTSCRYFGYIVFIIGTRCN